MHLSLWEFILSLRQTMIFAWDIVLKPWRTLYITWSLICNEPNICIHINAISSSSYPVQIVSLQQIIVEVLLLRSIRVIENLIYGLHTSPNISLLYKWPEQYVYCPWFTYVIFSWLHYTRCTKYSTFSNQGVGVTKPIFSVPLFSRFFQNYQNTCYIYDITFIFDRCRRSRAAETPGKYECDLRYLAYTFTKSNFPVTEKLTNGALVTPTPGP